MSHGYEHHDNVDEHRAALAGITDWMPCLDAHSGLPGPRGDLELVAACGEEADVVRAERLVAAGDEFATVCGLVALGRHLGQSSDAHLGLLHRYAADDRWRVREGVAMALQRAGDDDPDRAFGVAERWAADPDPLVRRAAVAVVCEPRLLRDPRFAGRALALLESVTSDLAASPGRIAALQACGRCDRRSATGGASLSPRCLPSRDHPATPRNPTRQHLARRLGCRPCPETSAG